MTKKQRKSGVGIDLIAIARLKKIKKSDFSRWTHVFADDEWKYAFASSQDAASRLADIFAAKEAAMKAYRLVGVKNFKRFRVCYDYFGVPSLYLRKANLAISHDQNMAIAVVII